MSNLENLSVQVASSKNVLMLGYVPSVRRAVCFVTDGFSPRNISLGKERTGNTESKETGGGEIGIRF